MAIQYVGTLVSTRIGRFRTTRQKYEFFVRLGHIRPMT